MTENKLGPSDQKSNRPQPHGSEGKNPKLNLSRATNVPKPSGTSGGKKPKG